MNQITIPKDLSKVEALIWLAKIGKRADGLARPLLYEINQNESYKEKGFDSFDQFVESPDGLDRSRGWASQQLTIHKVFTLDGGIPPEQVETIGMNRLYKAARLKDKTPEEKFAVASTWSLSDFKEDRKDECPGHEYELFCKHCWKRKE